MVICADVLGDISTPERPERPLAPLGKAPKDPLSGCDVAAVMLATFLSLGSRKGHVPWLDREIRDSAAVNVAAGLAPVVGDYGRLFAGI